MNTNQLKYFVAAADKKSLHKASDELYITHQCLSSAIRKLEEEMGTALFERTKQGVFLNKSGQEVYRMAQAILHEISTTQDKLCAENDVKVDTLSIMTSFGMSSLVFNDVLKKFRAHNKSVQFRIYNKGSLEALEALEKGKADLAYIGVPKNENIFERFDNVVCTEIFEEKMDLLMRVDHALSGFERISARQAFKYPILLYQPNVDERENFMVKRIYAIAPQAKIEMISDNIGLYNEMVASGMGLGFVGRSVVKSKVLAEDMSKLGLISVKMTDGFSMRIVCLINKSSLAKKEALICEFCKAFAANMYLKQLERYW